MDKSKNKNTGKKGSTALHQNVVKKTLMAMSSPHCRVWANNTGMIKTEDRVVRFGLKGSSDIIGIYKSYFLAIEVKTGNAKQNKFQKNFEEMVCGMGAIYVLITDKNVEQVSTIVEQKYQEILSWKSGMPLGLRTSD